MELAENVNEKRPSYTKSENIFSKVGDSADHGTDMAKSRLRGYMRTFVYIIFCGLILLIGGGTFFIYESYVMNKMPVDEVKPDENLPLGHSAQVSDSYVVNDKIHYSREFQIVAFVFIGVGATLLVIGAPLAIRYYRRYKSAKDSERSPILDPIGKNEKTKSKIYNPVKQGDSGKETSDPSSSTSTSKKAKIFRGKRKTKASWMNKSRKSFSHEGFRFAAHRHPSMNQITIDSSGFFDRRRISENSSGGSDDDISEIKDSPKLRPKSPRFMRFMSKIFGRKTGEQDGFEHSKMGSSSDSLSENNYGENDVTSSDSPTGRSAQGNNYGVNPSFESGNNFTIDKDGLYNLQE